MNISSREFARSSRRVMDKAESDAVTITRYGWPHVVLMSVKEYAELKRRNREHLTLVHQVQRNPDE